jgi:nitrogen regulatory protein P-II 1
VEKTVKAVLSSARTGEIGDGKIFILPIEESYRIRTGEKGDESLYIKGKEE